MPDSADIPAPVSTTIERGRLIMARIYHERGLARYNAILSKSFEDFIVCKKR